jgi:Ca-activated chloride channel family protein
VRTVTFAAPYFLLVLLVVPLVAGFAVWLDRRRARYAVSFTNFDVLASVAQGRRRAWHHWVPLALLLFALATAGVALGRPRTTVHVASGNATIVLLVDVSGSMRADDVKPTRLGAAQNAMLSFLSNMPSQVRVGLVSFSTEPDVLVPPTTDRGQMQEGIELLSPEAGTAIGDGLAVATEVAQSSVGHQHLAPGAKSPAAIVMLSDGAQTRGELTPLQGADRAKAAGIPVDTIALGTPSGTLEIGPSFGGFGGGRMAVRPDPATLRAIATDTGGTAFQARTASKVDSIYRALGSRVATKAERREVSSWFAGAAAGLLLSAMAAGLWFGPRF